MSHVAFFNMHGRLSCVTLLVIHVPTVKHQHKAISQCNRFVSSPSRSPGGPITGPSGPWRWFRERGRQKTRCDGKLLIHMLIKGHFLSAIRGWRLAYLGLDFCFISPPSSSTNVSASSVIVLWWKTPMLCCVSMPRKHYLITAGRVTRMYLASLWPCFWQYSYCKLNSHREQSEMLKSLFHTDTRWLERSSLVCFNFTNCVNSMKLWDRWLVQVSVIVMSCLLWISVRPESHQTGIHKATRPKSAPCFITSFCLGFLLCHFDTLYTYIF